MAHSSVTLAGDVVMPTVGFGTWKLRGQSAYEATRHALGAGYRHLDTATMYRNEAEVGRALRDSGVPREEVFLTTKLLPDDVGREPAAIAASLAALGVDRVDLWLMHWPPGDDAAMVACWRAMLAARDEGLARAVGVSNHSPAQLDRLAAETGETPPVNQIPWSPAEHDPALLAGHRRRGVVVEGYSPLRGSDLSDPELTAVAAAHGVSTAQVVLRWHLQHGIVVIPKSAHPGRIAENFDLAGFTLTDDEMDRIDRLGTP